MTYHNPSNELRCRRCKSTDIAVSESQQIKKVRGKGRMHADVRCNNCKHRWWSCHPDALAQSRAKDKVAGGA